MHVTPMDLSGGRLFSGKAATRWTVLFASLLFLSASQCNAQLLHKKKKTTKQATADNSSAPDKVLYDRALNDIKHGRHEVGRLSLQTLINTYPDSEYLAKAKLAIADSYYKEGGTSNMTQAIQAYKDFDIFFPFLQEAAYAQLQVANAHYQQMAKPDRDNTEAKAAEDEYQTFLTKYPKDPLAAKAEQRLRNVQEIIAEGDFRIGFFYYVKGDRRASAARLISLTRRYPLYSKSDRALWMLGDIFEKSEHPEIASLYYAQIVRNYPLSPLAPEAKNRLIAFKVPVPQPDAHALAWMTAEQNVPRGHVPFYEKPLALVHSGPGDELRAAARNGTPTMTSEDDNSSATDILSGGNRSQLGGSGTGSSAVVETVTPGTPAPAGENGATQSPAEGAAPTANGSEANPSNSAATPAAQPPATQPADGTPPAASATATPANGAAPDASKPDAAKPDAAAGTTPDAAAKTDTSKDTTDPKKESSSKKKKGLRKIVPW